MNSSSQHIPVLLPQVLELSELDHKPLLLLDATFGRGGHSKALIEKYPDLKIVALDQDQQAIDYTHENFKEELSSGKIQIFKKNFVDVDSVLPEEKFDLILVDLGVSSPQLDEPERGFSFYNDGPLDMRMDQNLKETAADIINQWSQQELSDLFYNLGEIKLPNKVVRAIVEKRKEKEFESTLELSHLIESQLGWRKKGSHPATKYFLALRLVVNKELSVTEQAMPKFLARLKLGGRLMVISFHSSEDRIIKNFFKSHKDQGKIITKKVVQASWGETKGNPRARSAKLRVFEKRDNEQS